MSQKSFNQILNEEAKKVLNTTSETLKQQYAKQTRIEVIILGLFLFGLFGGLGAFFTWFGTSVEDGLFVVIIGIIILIVSIITLIYCLHMANKSVEERALIKIKKNLRISNQRELKAKEEQAILNIPNFTIEKMFEGVHSKLLVDNTNKKFIFRDNCVDSFILKNMNNMNIYSKVYNFSDIISYEVFENGQSCVQGTVGSSLIGGAFFGIGGLIVGGNVARNINEYCNQLYLIIRINDFNNFQIKMNFINSNVDKNSISYKNTKSKLFEVCSMLEYMINNKTLEESSKYIKNTNNETDSIKSSLQELKEMYESGLVTEDEYNAKRKQILGL